MTGYSMETYKRINSSFSPKERSILTVGGIATAVSAIIYFVITVLIAIDPVGMYISGGEGFDTLLNNPYINVTWRLLFAFNNMLNVLIIPAFVLYVSKNNDKFFGLLNAAKIFMLSGVVLAAVNWVHFVEVTKIMLNQYKAGISMDTITGIHYFPIDSFFLWTWGLYGLGFFITNLIGLLTGRFTKKMGILGVICGLQLMLLVVFYIGGVAVAIAGVQYSMMMICAGLLGGITGPVFMFSCKKYYLA